MSLDREAAEALAERVRQGVNLRHAIDEAGLVWKHVRDDLKGEYSQLFRDAQEQYRQAVKG